jgi:hypothetical protein
MANRSQKVQQARCPPVNSIQKRNTAWLLLPGNYSTVTLKPIIMKTQAILSIMFLCLFHPSMAQTDSIKPLKVYRTWVIPYERGRVRQGVLYEVKDSSIRIARNYNQTVQMGEQIRLSTIYPRDIDVIKLRKKGNVGQGAIIGALAGMLIAGALDAIIISSWNKSKSNSFSDDMNDHVGRPMVIAGSVIIIAAGAGIGATIAGAKITIPIDGSQEEFENNKDRLFNHSIKSQR